MLVFINIHPHGGQSEQKISTINVKDNLMYLKQRAILTAILAYSVMRHLTKKRGCLERRQKRLVQRQQPGDSETVLQQQQPCLRRQGYSGQL
jgi:hypothetical protein